MPLRQATTLKSTWPIHQAPNHEFSARCKGHATCWDVRMSSCRMLRFVVKMSMRRVVEISSYRVIEILSCRVVEKSSCLDVEVFRCRDVEMSSCRDVEFVRFGIVQMSRFWDVKLSRSERWQIQHRLTKQVVLVFMWVRIWWRLINFSLQCLVPFKMFLL